MRANTRKTIILGAIVLVLYGLVFVNIARSFTGSGVTFLVDEDHGDAPYPRQQFEQYIGIWAPSLSRPGAKSFVKREDFLAIGANSIGFPVGVDYETDGTYNEREVQSRIEKARAFVRYYKKVGLAVMMAAQTRERGNIGVGIWDPPEWRKTAYLKNFEEVSVRFAQMAEEENVEVFVPFNDIDRGDRYIGPQRSSDWMQKILPRIREVYSGKIMWKGDLFLAVKNNESFDLTGYDMAAFVTPVSAGRDVVEAITDKKISELRRWAAVGGNPNLELVGIAGPTSFPGKREQVIWATDMLFGKHRDNLTGFMVLDLIPNVKDPKVHAHVQQWFTELDEN
jgi:hypothetical protein